MTDAISQEDQNAVDNAFKAASAYKLSYTMSADEQKSARTFLLKDPASYYNLQSYLNIAATLPSSVDMFNAQYPESKLGSLLKVDSTALNKVRETVVDLHAHCADFETNTMGQFVTLTGSILNYCDDFGRYVGGPKLLRDQMAIVIQDDPDLTFSQTPDFKHALAKARAILIVLNRRATGLQTNCEALVKGLIAFQGVTERDKVRVDFLYQNFIKGPPFVAQTSPATQYLPQVDQNGNPITMKDGNGSELKSYSAILQKDLDDLRKDLADQTKTAQDKYDEWKQDTIIASTAVTYIWIFPAGTIAAAATMSVYTARAVAAKEQYDTAETKITQDNQDIKAITDCLNLVQMMGGQIQQLEDAIGKAIEALRDMSALFKEQARAFEVIANKMGSTESFLKDDLDVVRQMAPDELDLAVKAWAEIRFLALDFSQHAPIQYVYR